MRRCWHAAPANTLFVVAGVGGNTPYVRWAYESKCKRQAGAANAEPWSLDCEAQLQRASERATRGALWLAVKQ